MYLVFFLQTSRSVREISGHTSSIRHSHVTEILANRTSFSFSVYLFHSLSVPLPLSSESYFFLTLSFIIVHLGFFVSTFSDTKANLVRLYPPQEVHAFYKNAVGVGRFTWKLMGSCQSFWFFPNIVK